MKDVRKCLKLRFCILGLLQAALIQQAQPTVTTNENIWKSACNKFVRSVHKNHLVAPSGLPDLHTSEESMKCGLDLTEKLLSPEKYFKEGKKGGKNHIPVLFYFPKKHGVFNDIEIFLEIACQADKSPRVFVDIFSVESLAKALCQVYPRIHEEAEPVNALEAFARAAIDSSYSAPYVEDEFVTPATLKIKNAAEQNSVKQKELAASHTSENFKAVLQLLGEITMKSSTIGEMIRFGRKFESPYEKLNNVKVGLDLPFIIKICELDVNSNSSFENTNELFSHIIKNIDRNTQYFDPSTQGYLISYAWKTLMLPQMKVGPGDLRFYVEALFQNSRNPNNYQMLFGVEVFHPMKKPDTYIPRSLEQSDPLLLQDFYANPNGVNYNYVRLIDNIRATLDLTLLNAQLDLERDGIGCYTKVSMPIPIDMAQCRFFTNVGADYFFGLNQPQMLPLADSSALTNKASLIKAAPIVVLKLDAGFELQVDQLKFCCGYDLYAQAQESFQSAVGSNILAQKSHQHSVFFNLVRTAACYDTDFFMKLSGVYNFGSKGNAQKPWISDSWGLGLSISCLV